MYPLLLLILVALRHIDRYANVTARKECYVVLFVCGRSELRDTKDQPILSNDRERAKEREKKWGKFNYSSTHSGCFSSATKLVLSFIYMLDCWVTFFFSLNIMGRGYISPITDLDGVNGCLPQTAGGKFLSENIFFSFAFHDKSQSVYISTWSNEQMMYASNSLGPRTHVTHD